MDFSLYAIPGVSLKAKIAANIKYYIMKDQRATDIKNIDTGLITLIDHCPVFQFSTSPLLEEFNRPFYSNWTCSTSIYLLRGDNQSPCCLAVTMEIDLAGQIALDAQSTALECLTVPYRPFLAEYNLPGCLWEIRKQRNGIIQLENGRNLHTDPSAAVCLTSFETILHTEQLMFSSDLDGPNQLKPFSAVNGNLSLRPQRLFVETKLPKPTPQKQTFPTNHKPAFREKL
jgi:hypothetical protein